MNPRTATFSRTTAETRITATLTVDGQGRANIATAVPFLDHLLTALVRHARFDLDLTATGDLAVDDHHTVEDTAIVLGTAFDRALGDRIGIARFAHAYAPLDESLVRAVVDLGGRPWAEVQLPWRRPSIGGLAMENVAHWFRSFATASRLCLHLDVLRGDNDHHRSEAAFKALAVALRAAVVRTDDVMPSTKETLT